MPVTKMRNLQLFQIYKILHTCQPSPYINRVSNVEINKLELTQTEHY